MSVPERDWPTALADIWAAKKRLAPVVDTAAQVEGLIDLIASMYQEKDLNVAARAYVQSATAADRPGWASAGRAVWALGLWRRGEDDAALLQLILAELQLQEEMRQPRPEADGGPTGIGAASNNLGVAYAALELFELAEPHLQRACEVSQRDYGDGLEMQVCADLANVAEVRVRWALYGEAVAAGDRTMELASQARDDADTLLRYAASIGVSEAVRFARMLQTGAVTILSPESVNLDHRDELLESLRSPVFGDEPGEVLMRAVAARVCRIVGDAEGCWQQAARVAALNRAAYHASTIIALHEAARAEGPGQHTWAFAAAVAAESEATRRRIVTSFQARLGLAGLEQRFEQVSQERRSLQLALQDALRQEAELVHAATHDALTGLPNRAMFDQQLAAVLEVGPLERSATVAYVDVDDFKAVNDTHGHSAGDAVLRWLAEQLRAAAGSNDLVARLGGDEFAVLLSSGTDEAAMAWRETLLDRIREADPPFGISVSVGVCVVAPDATSVEDVLHLADIQMYEAKRRRKASVESAPGDP